MTPEALPDDPEELLDRLLVCMAYSRRISVVFQLTDRMQYSPSDGELRTYLTAIEETIREGPPETFDLGEFLDRPPAPGDHDPDDLAATLVELHDLTTGSLDELEGTEGQFPLLRTYWRDVQSVVESGVGYDEVSPYLRHGSADAYTRGELFGLRESGGPSES